MDVSAAGHCCIKQLLLHCSTYLRSSKSPISTPFSCSIATASGKVSISLQHKTVMEDINRSRGCVGLKKSLTISHFKVDTWLSNHSMVEFMPNPATTVNTASKRLRGGCSGQSVPLINISMVYRHQWAGQSWSPSNRVEGVWHWESRYYHQKGAEALQDSLSYSHLTRYPASHHGTQGKVD